MSPPIDEPHKMAESKRRRHSIRASFGDSAPPNTLPFPDRANMTIVEILAFLPNSINCPDVIYRMISNGGTRKAIHAIINTHRDFETEWSANCCGEAMYKTMNKGGYPDWTIKKHDLWHDSRRESWDGSRLEVGGLRTQAGPVGSVSFTTLAENVRTMPVGHDALDLTRMVKYCVENDGECWRYPKDYEELLDLLGGPAKVRQENTDGVVFDRWEKRKPPPPTGRPSHATHLYDAWRRTKRSSSVSRRRPSDDPGPKSVLTGAGLLANDKAAEMQARTGTHSEVMETAADSHSHVEVSTPYTRAPAEYVPPLSADDTPPTLSTLTRLVQAEGFAGESDSHSAYAFGGARCAPPYRRLHQIAQPHPWDSSGWAENLRWAFEQRILFAKERPEVEEWNESPDHMKRIERQRTQRVWASEELLDLLGCE